MAISYKYATTRLGKIVTGSYALEIICNYNQFGALQQGDFFGNEALDLIVNNLKQIGLDQEDIDMFKESGQNLVGFKIHQIYHGVYSGYRFIIQDSIFAYEEPNESVNWRCQPALYEVHFGIYKSPISSDQYEVKDVQVRIFNETQRPRYEFR